MYHSPRRRKKIISSRRSRTSRYGRRQSRNNKSLFPLLVLGGLIALIIWGISSIFSSDKPIEAFAVLQIRQGVVEFAFEGESIWTRANSGQKFLSGDRVRCTGNCEATLEVLDGGSVIALAPMTEVEFSKLKQWEKGEKVAEIILKEGELWASIAADEFDNNKSRFEIRAQHSLIEASGSVFDIVSDRNRDHVRVVRGEINMHALEGYSSKKAIELNEGQEIRFDKSVTELYLASEGPKAIEALNSSFEESDWNLKNLELFRPQEAASIRHRIEIAASPVQQDPSKNGLEAPQILEPINGAVIPASLDFVKIEGTAPTDTYHISVNGYTLTKYNAGDRKWSYFASKKFGTLVPGENVYKVVASSRDGRESQPTEVKIIYEGVSPSQAAAPVPVEEVQSDFPVPVITFPALSDATKAFETTEPVLKISGIVDPRTVAVEVNDYKLQRYQPGDTTWSYTANAQYSNFKYGENYFTVVAIGPEGERSSSSIKVILVKP